MIAKNGFVPLLKKHLRGQRAAQTIHFTNLPVPVQYFVHYLLAAFAGLLMTLSFAPTRYGGWLEFIPFIFIFALIARTRTVLDAALTGLAFGLSYFLSGLFWLTISMHVYGGMPALLAWAAFSLFSLYLAAYPAVACALSRITDISIASFNVTNVGWRWHSSLAFASAWTLTEWLRGTLFTGFPWLVSGYAQVDGPLAGYAAIVGVYGVGGLVVLIAALTVQMVGAAYCSMRRMSKSNAKRDHQRDKQPVRAVVAPLSVIAAIMIIGSFLSKIEWTQPQHSPITVRLLQGNIAQQMKFSPSSVNATIALYQQLITEQPADLIVTPETAAPLLVEQLPLSFVQTIRDFADQTGSSIVFGAIGIGIGGIPPTDTSQYRLTNSLFGITPNVHRLYQYNKRHLVPFGEFVPLGFHWFINLMKVPLGDFARGAVVQPLFQVDHQSLALGICYEDLFGEEIARTLREAPLRASVLVNATNLGWFGHTIALDQHLQIARMRSLETGRPLLRATNTGITAAIDHHGRVIGQLPVLTFGALTARIQGMVGKTPYIAYGNLPVLLLSMLLILYLNRRFLARFLISNNKNNGKAR